MNGRLLKAGRRTSRPGPSSTMRSGLLRSKRSSHPLLGSDPILVRSHRKNGMVCYLRFRNSKGTTRRSAMAWEYKMVQIAGRPEKTIDELNLLGSEGWEAVSVWADAI